MRLSIKSGSSVFRRWSRVAMGFIGGLVWTVMTSPAGAAEYYSWIDPSGTAVLTDDPGRIPPASERSWVSVHRYRDPVLPFSRSHTEMSSPGTVEQAPIGMPELSGAARISGLDPAEIDAPDMLLDQPQEAGQSGYVWMPLHAPLFDGRRSFSGFWWRPGRTAPIDAFNTALRQRAGQSARSHWSRGRYRTRVFANQGAVSSGNAVYDRVVRERQVLQQAGARGALIGPRSMGTAISSGHGRSSFGGRASAR